MNGASEKTADQNFSKDSSATGTRRYRNQTGEERRQDRRSRLVQAGIDMFAERGYHATSIDGLCGAAGVSTRNFYEEFRNKEALIIAIYEDVNARAFAAVGEAVAQHRDSPLHERVRAPLEAYLTTTTENPRAAQVIYLETASVSPVMEQRRRATVEAFGALILAEGRRAAEAGMIPDRDLTLTSIALVGAIRELAINTAMRDDLELGSVIDEATALIISALESSPRT